ncbi:hypothetical protein [Paenibacillus polymyxa]|uniref:hypothetical protein n=1 Tax=Paenibacillus polymyxa TaxID=1406 RepID=UPI0004716028|nr:hypothetical protein [Paenibacillus polymyxa]
MSERTYKLLNGKELILNDNGELWMRHPELGIATMRVESVLGDLLALVDSLQQTASELATEQAYAKRMAGEWNDKAIAYRDERDALQQQVKELEAGNRAACESREVAVRKAREACVTSNQHFAKVVELVDQLAERGRTIADLMEELECFRAKAAPESLGYGAKWKQKAMKAREERNKLHEALEEIANTKYDMSGVICRVTARQALGRE